MMNGKEKHCHSGIITNENLWFKSGEMFEKIQKHSSEIPPRTSSSGAIGHFEKNGRLWKHTPSEKKHVWSVPKKRSIEIVEEIKNLVKNVPQNPSDEDYRNYTCPAQPCDAL